jgi:cytochrome c oxidase cbb3-type subunit 3
MAKQVKNNSQSQKGFSEDATHEYDGIKELNNPPPAWIIIIFLVTIGFSLLYLVHYFGYPDNQMDQESEYKRKVAAFEEKVKKNQEDAATTKEISLDEILAAGEDLYIKHGCIACHGQKGEGNAIGPNLTDNYWIHGCAEEDVVSIIRDGNPLKGMTAFGNKMSDKQISSLSQYILVKMVDSNPENPKEAQGEECN